MASVGNSPQLLHPRLRVVVVETLRFQKGLQGPGGFFGVVTRNLVEEVMSDMGASDTMVEKVEDSIRTVDGGEGSLHPSPILSSVVGDRGVGVLQPGVQDQPGIDIEVGEEIPKDDGQSSVVGTQTSQQNKGDESSNSRDKHTRALLGGEHWGLRAEMVGNTSVERGSIEGKTTGRGYSGEVDGPSNTEMGPEHEHSESIISHNLVPPGHVGLTFTSLGDSVLLSGGRNMRLTIHQMVGTAMVLGVGEFPRKVGDQQGLVQNKSDHVVEQIGCREGSMTTLVGQNPQASQDSPHPKGVQTPSNNPSEHLEAQNVSREIGREELFGNVNDSGGHQTITNDKSQRTNSRTLETFLGDGGFNFALSRELVLRIFSLLQGAIRTLPLVFNRSLRPHCTLSPHGRWCFQRTRQDKKERKKKKNQLEITNSDVKGGRH